jgi:ribose 5-phosphate isomerase B
MALGGRTLGLDVALDMVQVFLTTGFEGGHHKDRIVKLHELEV